MGQAARSVSAEVKWVPTDPHGALPGRHWQGTVTVDGEIAFQRRYFKKHLALHDCFVWLGREVETEQEIDALNERRS